MICGAFQIGGNRLMSENGKLKDVQNQKSTEESKDVWKDTTLVDNFHDW
jgi:hypothetical protein